MREKIFNNFTLKQNLVSVTFIFCNNFLALRKKENTNVKDKFFYVNNRADILSYKKNYYTL